MAAHKEKEDLIAIGAYQPGADPVVDEAIAKRGAIEGFLQQRVDEPSTIAEADAGLMALAAAPVPPTRRPRCSTRSRARAGRRAARWRPPVRWRCRRSASPCSAARRRPPTSGDRGVGACRQRLE